MMYIYKVDLTRRKESKCTTYSQCLDLRLVFTFLKLRVSAALLVYIYHFEVHAHSVDGTASKVELR